jgi:hypothetical protein
MRKHCDKEKCTSRFFTDLHISIFPEDEKLIFGILCVEKDGCKDTKLASA